MTSPARWQPSSSSDAASPHQETVNRISGGRPRVSVIVPTLDRPNILGEALDSIARQDLNGDVEVIVVNDGGQPLSPVVRRREGELAIRLIELDRRTGPATARNAGIQVAAGDYIAFLDDDDLFAPGHLSAGCEPLDRDEADFVCLGEGVR